MNEGLQFRIKKLLPGLESPSVTELLKQLKTKRYTHTKLQRTCCMSCSSTTGQP